MRLNKQYVIFFYTVFMCFQSASSIGLYRLDRFWPELEQPWYFNSPQAIEIGADGLIYVADTGNHRIQVFTQTGEFVRRWGKRGEGPGEFLWLNDIAIGSDGLVYAADSQRIQIFNRSGEFIGSFHPSGLDTVSDNENTTGSGNTNNNQTVNSGAISPRRISVGQNGLIYVMPYRLDKKIYVYNTQGDLVRLLKTDSDDDRCCFSDIAVNSNGTVFVSFGSSEVSLFSADGVFIKRQDIHSNSGDSQSAEIIGLAALENGLVAVLSRSMTGSRVRLITLLDAAGQTVDTRVITSNDNIPFSVTGSVVSADNTVFMLNVNQGVQVFDADNRLVNQWSSAGSDEGHFDFDGIGSVAIGPDGLVYVIDGFNFRVQVFAPDGTFIRAWDYSLGNLQQSFFPSDIAVGADHQVYLASAYNGSIRIFTATGRFVRAWGRRGSEHGQFERIEGIAMDKQGLVYVLDSGNQRVQVFNERGEFIRSWSNKGVGEGKLANTTGIAIDEEDLIYLLTDSGNRVHVFNSHGDLLRNWEVTAGLNQFQFTNHNGSSPSTSFNSFDPAGTAIAIGQDNLVYIVNNKRGVSAGLGQSVIQIFDTKGNFIETVFPERVVDMHGSLLGAIAISQGQDIITIDSANNRVIKLTPGAPQPFSFSANMLSGSWYNPHHNGEGLAVEVLSGKQAHLTWYTYDKFGNQAWLSGVGEVDGNTITVPNALITRGGIFGPSFNPETVQRNHWGEITMTFSDCNQATVNYNGAPGFGFGTLPVERLTALSSLDCNQSSLTNRKSSLAGISGSWYDPAHNGEGFVIQVLENDLAVVYWFTYDADGSQMWVTGTGQIQGRRIVLENSMLTEQGIFGSDFNPQAVQRKDWGRIIFEFSSCNTGSVRYDSSAGFGSGQMNLSRLTSLHDDNCELLP